MNHGCISPDNYTEEPSNWENSNILHEETETIKKKRDFN